MRKGDVPPAFDLRKYEACKTWKPNMWLSALLARRSRGYLDIVANNIGASRKNVDSDFSSIEPDDTIWQLWMEAHKDTANWFLNNPSGSLELYVSGSFVEDQKNIDLLEVCFLTDFLEEGGHPGEIGREWINAIESSYQQFSEHVEPQYRNLASFYQWAIGTKDPFLLAYSSRQRELFGVGPGQIFMGERHFIGVDLHATDSVLVEEFKRWLKKKRAETGVRSFKAITKEHLQRFANLDLLPYLDLHFWEITHETKIPDAEILKVLGLDSQGMGQYVKDTLRREAIQMIDDSTFYGLRALAAQQANEED